MARVSIRTATPTGSLSTQSITQSATTQMSATKVLFAFRLGVPSGKASFFGTFRKSMKQPRVETSTEYLTACSIQIQKGWPRWAALPHRQCRRCCHRQGFVGCCNTPCVMFHLMSILPRLRDAALDGHKSSRPSHSMHNSLFNTVRYRQSFPTIRICDVLRLHQEGCAPFRLDSRLRVRQTSLKLPVSNPAAEFSI